MDNKLKNEIFEQLKNADFKKTSKSDVIDLATKLRDLNPETVKALLAQFPEFVTVMKNFLGEFGREIDNLLADDTEILKEYYQFANKIMDNAGDSRRQYYDFLREVRADITKPLENPDLPPEIILEILSKAMELAKMADKKDSETREQEKEASKDVKNETDQKRVFNMVGILGKVVIVVCGCVFIAFGFALRIPLVEK